MEDFLYMILFTALHLVFAPEGESGQQLDAVTQGLHTKANINQSYSGSEHSKSMGQDTF